MPIWLQIASFVFAALTVAGWVLRLVDIAADREDKERIKERIEQFWLETSDLGFPKILKMALVRRYERTRRLRLGFMKVFWLLCTLIMISSVASSYHERAGAEGLKGLVQLSFDFRFVVTCSFENQQRFKDDKDGLQAYCEAEKSEASSPTLNGYREKRDAYYALIDQWAKDRPVVITMSEIATPCIILIFVCFPLSLALWLSFNLTLWLLSRITKSRLFFLPLLIFDVLIVGAMPPLLTSFMTCIAIGGTIAIFGVPDIFAFAAPSWTSLTVGTAGLLLFIEFLLPALLGLLVFALPTAWAIVSGVFLVLLAPVLVAYGRMMGFVGDVQDAAALKWTNDTTASVIDWAIVIDIMYSFTFLGPSFVLVVASRNKTTRKVFMNFAMLLHDHQRGPIFALSELFSTLPRIRSNDRNSA